jgi:hypothetical protein
MSGCSFPGRTSRIAASCGKARSSRGCVSFPPESFIVDDGIPITKEALIGRLALDFHVPEVLVSVRSSDHNSSVDLYFIMKNLKFRK